MYLISALLVLLPLLGIGGPSGTMGMSSTFTYKWALIGMVAEESLGVSEGLSPGKKGASV